MIIKYGVELLDCHSSEGESGLWDCRIIKCGVKLLIPNYIPKLQRLHSEPECISYSHNNNNDINDNYNNNNTNNNDDDNDNDNDDDNDKIKVIMIKIMIVMW